MLAESKSNVSSLWSRSWYVNNPKIVVFEGQGASGVQLDFFMLQKQKTPPSIFENLVKGGGKDYSFTCFACQIHLINFQNTIKHCKHPNHKRKEMEKIEADGDAFFKEMDIKMKTAVEMRLQTTKDCFLSRPDFAFIGLQFMIELIPNECDEPSIFLCPLPFCEFRGVGPELLEHCSSIVHLRGFLDVYGLLEDANNNDIFSSCKFLYDGNISHYGKDPTRLIKRVFHTFDYNNAKRGRYPGSYHDLVQNIQEQRVMNRSRFNQAMNFQHTVMSGSDRSYDTPSTSDSFDERLPFKSANQSSSSSEMLDHTFERTFVSRVPPPAPPPPPPAPIPIPVAPPPPQPRRLTDMQILEIMAVFKNQIKGIVRTTLDRRTSNDEINNLTAKLYQDELLLHLAAGSEMRDLRMNEVIFRRVKSRIRFPPMN